MQKDYETFVEKLEIGIYEATGIPRENISFEKEGEIGRASCRERV